MRMREDELHEPKRVRVTEPNGWNVCYKFCAVCGLKMLGEDNYNYCPKCGARLKEVEDSMGRG